MRLEAKKRLYDIMRAAAILAEFTDGKSIEDYERDIMLRSAVERQFTIIGEAMAQLARFDAEVAARISEYPRIIGFRNVLIHEYADINDILVWGMLEADLPKLIGEVRALLGGSESGCPDAGEAVCAALV